MAGIDRKYVDEVRMNESLGIATNGVSRIVLWLSHVKIDPEASNTQAEGVEIDDWGDDGHYNDRYGGSMVVEAPSSVI